jgi:hypothetical protein
MKKTFFLLFFWWGTPTWGQTLEPPNFSILGQVGAGQVSGFLGKGTFAPGGGLWLGISLSDRFDGLWGIDYFTMPNQEVAVSLNPSKLYPATSMNVMATDDFSFTVNTRWYWASKYDSFHGRFNTVPYLVGGFGMDMVVDQDPRLPNSNFYSASFDALFSLNLGMGMDFPVDGGKKWFLYAEGLDHMIAWQGLTQIYSLRAGFKVMLDSEHVDPFRGVF